jgi:hypothetical protein
MPVTANLPSPGHDAGVEFGTKAAAAKVEPAEPGGPTMKTRTHIVMISVALLWLLTGAVSVVASPSQLGAQTHSQMLQAHPRMP